VQGPDTGRWSYFVEGDWTDWMMPAVQATHEHPFEDERMEGLVKVVGNRH
jgi:hypothetical protein